MRTRSGRQAPSRMYSKADSRASAISGKQRVSWHTTLHISLEQQNHSRFSNQLTFRRRAFLEKRLEQVVLGGGREVESGEHVACIAQRVVSRLLDRPHAANTAESREERAHHCSAPSGCVLLQNISASRTNLLC